MCKICRDRKNKDVLNVELISFGLTIVIIHSCYVIASKLRRPNEIIMHIQVSNLRGVKLVSGLTFPFGGFYTKNSK